MQCVHFELSNADSMANHPPILLQNTSLSYVECVKYLGVYIDANLNWKSHTSNVLIKISQGCGIIQYSYNFFLNFVLKFVSCLSISIFNVLHRILG